MMKTIDVVKIKEQAEAEVGPLAETADPEIHPAGVIAIPKKDLLDSGPIKTTEVVDDFCWYQKERECISLNL